MILRKKFGFQPSDRSELHIIVQRCVFKKWFLFQPIDGPLDLFHGSVRVWESLKCHIHLTFFVNNVASSTEMVFIDSCRVEQMVFTYIESTWWELLVGNTAWWQPR